MKKLLMLLTVLSFQVFAQNNNDTLKVRIITANCSVRYGIGDIEYAYYDGKKLVLEHANVINDKLCKKGSYGKFSKLTDIAMNSLLGHNGNRAVKYMHEIEISLQNVVTDIYEVEATSRKDRRLYKKFNLLDYNNYTRVDNRFVQSEMIKFYPHHEDIVEELKKDLAQEER